MIAWPMFLKIIVEEIRRGQTCSVEGRSETGVRSVLLAEHIFLSMLVHSVLLAASLEPFRKNPAHPLLSTVLRPKCKGIPCWQIG